MPYEAPPDLRSMSLLDIARAVEERRLPPVESWNPGETADSRMRIGADGSWFHEGRPIVRPAMVRAFASLLLRDDEGRLTGQVEVQDLATAEPGATLRSLTRGVTAALRDLDPR